MILTAGVPVPVKILVVEDDSLTRKIIEKIFETMGIEALFAENGKIGLEVFRINRPDIVISDYSMPEMNGLEMLSRIGSEAPHVKLVLMTIYTESQVLIDAINLGVDRFIEKPVSRDRLEKIVRLLIDDVRLAKELARYQNILKAYRMGVDSSTLVSLMDPEGHYLFVNEVLCEKSGYTENELVGKHYSFARRSQDKNDIQAVIDSGSDSGMVWQGFMMNISREGSEYLTEVTIQPVAEDGEVTGYISIEKDMSFVVEEQMKQLQSFMDADSSVMFVLNSSMELEMCNEAFCGFFRYASADEAVEKDFCLLDFLENEKCRSSGDGSHRECGSSLREFFKKSDSEKLSKVTLRGVGDDKEYYFTVHCFVLSQAYVGLDDLKVVRLNDITELEELKREELTGAMLASIGKMSAGITHEINTPLTYIKGNVELLEWDVEESLSRDSFDQLKDYFSSVKDGIERIHTIIQSMKEITGEASSERQHVNLYSTLVVAGRMIHNRAKHISPVYLNSRPLNLESGSDEELHTAHIIPKMLEQVWIILLNNSLDQLANSSLGFDERYIKITLESLPGGKHKITIADNGGGIDPKIINRLFDLFASTKKHKGMGIGLNIAKSIIDRHDGRITPYNSDEGAVFEIII